MDCVQFADVAEELALGTLTGVERAQALDHLERCEGCGNFVRELSSVADKLFELAAPVEPPVGFEGRVLGRMSQRPTRHRRLWMWPAAAAGAAAAVAAALVLVLTGTKPAHQAGVVSAPLVAAGHPIGTLIAYRGSPGWVYMSVDLGEATGSVTCELSQRDGATVKVGTFRVNGGYGYWDAPIKVDLGQVTTARLVDASGVTVASARINK